jgi:hypothetical protein
MSSDREIELKVGLKEAIDLIEWFESWLRDRDEPVRYDPIGMQAFPPTFTVNYDESGVAKIKTFLKAILNEERAPVGDGD